MPSRFASVLEEEILKIIDEGIPLNTKKATKFGVSLFDDKFLFFYFILFSYILMLSLVLAHEIDCGRPVIKI